MRNVWVAQCKLARQEVSGDMDMLKIAILEARHKYLNKQAAFR
jgi:hypothetical protein